MIEILEQLGYFGMFIASFLAATIIPFSSDVLLYGFFYTGLSVPILLSVATFGNTLGGMTSYLMGYFAKWEWLTKYFKVKKESVSYWQKSIERYGFVMALLCWLPLVGDVIAVALGFFRIKFWPVLLGMLIGKMLRYVGVYYVYVHGN